MYPRTAFIFISLVYVAVSIGFNGRSAWSADFVLAGALNKKTNEILTLSEIEETDGPLTLNHAVALALLKNQELAAFSTERRVTEARSIQSGLLPNPEISALVENVGGVKEKTGGGQATIQLSQRIELGGKRLARTRVAALSQNLAEKDYEKKRIEILTEVYKAFIKTLSAQQKLSIAEEMVRLAEQVAKAVSERVAAGKVSPVEEIKANVALSAARIDHGRSRMELEAVRKRLSSTWGNISPRFGKAVGDMEEHINPVLPLEQLSAQLNKNPELVRSAVEILQRRAAIEMEKAKAVPDISVNAGYRRFTDYAENSVVFGITIPLPLFNRNQGSLLESSFLLTKAEEERRAAEVKAAAALAEAYKALSIAYGEITALKEKVLPWAQSVFEATSQGYSMGKFSYLDVLDAQRTLFDVRLQRLRALTDYHLAIADVKQLIGEQVKMEE